MGVGVCVVGSFKRLWHWMVLQPLNPRSIETHSILRTFCQGCSTPHNPVAWAQKEAMWGHNGHSVWHLSVQGCFLVLEKEHREEASEGVEEAV